MTRRKLIVSSIAVIVAAGVGVAVPLAAGAGSDPSSVTQTSEATTTSTTSPASAPKGLTGQPGAPASAPATQCGSNFFSQTEGSALTAHFGLEFGCFTLDGGQHWILVFAGQSSTPSDVAPFGSYTVAVATCADGDSTCTDGDVPHNTSSFVFYSPPVPAVLANPTDLQGRFGTNVLMLTDGACGVVLFDTTTGSWYELTTPANTYSAAQQATSLAAGSTADTTPFPEQPQPVSAATALNSTATEPSATGICPS